MTTYTTTKKIHQVANQQILGWLLAAIGVLLFVTDAFTKDLNSFQNFGAYVDDFIFGVLGTVFIVQANKKIREIKGIELSFGEAELIYKTPTDENVFNLQNPPKLLKKNVFSIEIISSKDQVITIDLKNFKLDQQELKHIDNEIQRLKSLFANHRGAS